MKKRLLAVDPPSTNYLHIYDVTVARSYDQAKEMLQQAEQTGVPFETLDIPACDKAKFWEFVEWMEQTGRNYSFSIFGITDTDRFWQIVENLRARGFHINT